MPYSSRTAIHEQLTPNEGITFTEFARQLAMPIADIAEARTVQRPESLAEADGWRGPDGQLHRWETVLLDEATLTRAQATKAPQRTEPAIERHNRLREMDDAARGRQASRRTSTKEVRPAPGVYGMPMEFLSERYLPAMRPDTLARSLAESTAPDFGAAEKDPWSFNWRASINDLDGLNEFLNGMAG